MADTFGDQDKDGKRPAPTIEGVATEVAVEPVSGPSASAGASRPEPEPPHSAGDGASEPRQAASAPASPAELKTFLTHMAAGLLGGLVGVLALAFAWGWLPGGGKKAAAPDLSGLEQRLAKLEANPPAADGETLKALGERLAALEGRAPPTPPDLTDLNARVDSLELSLKTLTATADKGGSVPDAAALDTAVGAAEQRLQAKLDAALGDVATVDKTAIEDLEREVAELKKRVGALAENSASGAVPADTELAALNARISKLEAALPALTAAIDTGANQTKGAALALAFANLRDAVAAGRPYTTELAALITLAPEDSGLAALASHADAGIPTLPELARSFTAASETALASASTPAEPGYVNSLLQSVQSLVKIRRIDANATGDAPGAVLARARADLAQGDLGLSVKEVDGLSGVPREAFAGWLDRARSRLAADDTMNRLESTLLASLAAPAPASPAQAPPSR